MLYKFRTACNIYWNIVKLIARQIFKCINFYIIANWIVVTFGFILLTKDLLLSETFDNSMRSVSKPPSIIRDAGSIYCTFEIIVDIYFKTLNKSLNKARVLYLRLTRGVWVLPPEDSSLSFNLSSKLEDKLEDREKSSGHSLWVLCGCKRK